MGDVGDEVESWLSDLEVPEWVVARDGTDWIVGLPAWHIGGRGRTLAEAAADAINDARAHIAHHYPQSVTQGSRPVLPHGGTLVWLHPERVARAILDSRRP